jgi:hypothetical protein
MAEQNFLFGRGKVYLALESDGFAPPAYRYLGQTPGFEVTLAPERVELKSSDGPTRETLASVVTDLDATGTVTCHNVGPENQALFVSGDVSTVTQAAEALSFQIANIQQGFSYFLGELADDITNFRDVTSIAISGATVGDDYTIDNALGLLQIVRGGAISEGSTITVTGNKTARTWDRVKSSDNGAVRCRLKFVADNASGKNANLTLPLVSLAPSGTLAMQSEDFVTLDFEYQILKPASNERIIIDGEPVGAS